MFETLFAMTASLGAILQSSFTVGENQHRQCFSTFDLLAVTCFSDKTRGLHLVLNGL